MITYRCKTSPTLRSKHKNPPPSTPHDLHMFRFMIIWSLVVQWVKPTDGGHSHNARSDLIIALSQALSFLFPFFFLGRSPFFGLVNLQDQKMNFFCFELAKNRLLLFLYYYFQRVHFLVLQVNKTKKWTQNYCLFVCRLAHHLLINNMRQ